MNAVFRIIEPEDLFALSHFLARIYRLEPSNPLFDTKLLEWKYLRPRPDWGGVRSHVLEQNGQIVAHCGIWPVTFRTLRGKAIASFTLTDWAADSSIPGIGIMLLRKLAAMGPCFVIGGAAVTRQILPRIGFRPIGLAKTYCAWLRPWREFLVRPRTARSALRLLHGWTHPARKGGQTDELWTCTQVGEFTHSLQAILNGRKRSWTTCQRTLGDLNYLLQCPRLETSGFVLQRQGELAGYCIVGRFGWEARLLDVMVDSGDVEDWNGALQAITRTIRLDLEVCRIRTLAAVPILSEAAKYNGYWSQYTEPVFLHDPSGTLEGEFPISFQLCDGDAGL